MGGNGGSWRTGVKPAYRYRTVYFHISKKVSQFIQSLEIIFPQSCDMSRTIITVDNMELG